MAVTQLGLYNEALRIIGERRLSSLSENREPRRLLDDAWNADAIDYVLEQGLWNFAMRAIQITYSETVTPAFGLQYAFDQPTDHIRTAAVCEDEYFKVPVTNYVEEVDFWFADFSPLYIRYVSNASTYGNDLTRWPPTFAKYVAAYLAAEIVLALTSDPERKKLTLAVMQQRLKDARSKDAMADPTQFPAQGNWSASRHGNSKRDRGNRNQLIG